MDTRYADDWAIALTATSTKAKNIKIKIGNFISNQLFMQLNTDKTKITDTKKSFNFLSFNYKMSTTQRLKYIKRQGFRKYLARTLNRKTFISVDNQRLRRHLKEQSFGKYKKTQTNFFLRASHLLLF